MSSRHAASSAGVGAPTCEKRRRSERVPRRPAPAPACAPALALVPHPALPVPTAGASAPAVLTDENIDAFKARHEVAAETVTTADETMFFPLPRELREPA